MTAEIAKFGHIALITPNLEKSVWFFRDIVGLEEVDRQGDTIFLRAWGDWEHHTLSLTPGNRARVDHIAWRTKRPEDVETFAEQLKAKGTEVQWIEPGEEKGQGKAIRFRLPNGYPFEIYYDVEKPKAPEGKKSRLKNNVYRPSYGIAPRRIDHVNVWTTNPSEIHQWLKDNMGFKMREYIRLNNGFVAGGWMSVTPLVHDIGVMVDPKGQPNRLHHFAYYLDNVTDILRAADILREHDITIEMGGPGRHGISQAFFLYVKDPGSGHRLELFSGGYLIFDPDWEPIEWQEHELQEGLIWYGPEMKPGGPMDDTTEC
ncbi:2,3-dihydroxybiphenyl 1,2-dioxygenase (plasmid) [Geobacillus genomosp. 3]|uniref:Manganese-dependent 2,3-dihydroxybiphenyl 1,2-dioxygenase n=2 Tax=Geobacillus genomosp. 3 TaxID=1921421 RepID=BPHC_GEOG3|nr:manganese-dependent 2,3-dihydroxybiphenyl 1,2-dioxygenase [Geobacillus genomosp. 3]Q8GR45.1 RecName: Full=Manganese-dependent 2,3-dihydroxybiphenyl 1,2-dioxygenase; AltName: Full=Mn(II)-dependent 2,3-dihydroxybiphenyl 1,2-dioxygenase; AltName: Full=Mn(II)-dependent 23OHBP oxygenase [Geobacillus genomosp. 3]AGT33885.1 2,3-dihydroxybiphenyl 1,2-dioxygenase [Geobacillus genomosp. 3]BAC23089.1 2,3-dihydroxybiphenyl 1,2-dioxygenase [Geobacillus genomosp. 3]